MDQMTSQSSRSVPGGIVLLASSVAARLPLAMIGVSLLVHAQRLTGSFAVAGIVSGAYAIARGIGSPILGRMVDRRGQTIVLLISAAVSTVVLSALALVPFGAPRALFVGLAAVLGLASPPLAACMRSLLPELVTGPEKLRAAYGLETAVLELTFILGPPLALGIGAMWGSGAALGAGGAVLLCATVVFALQPASRGWRPAAAPPRQRGGSLRSPGMRTLVLIMLFLGAVFGAVDVGVTAAAKAAGSTVAAGPLLGLWGVGSLIGGIVATRRSGGGGVATSPVGLLAGLAGGHAALAVATSSAVGMGVVLLIAGLAIAPTTAAIYALVDRVVPGGTRTEAFSWLLTAGSLGASGGMIGDGALVQASGAPAACALAGALGGLAVLIAIVRAPTVNGDAGRSRSVRPLLDPVPST